MSTLPLCDVCGRKPTYLGLRYGQCKTCHVGVHLACYGLGGPNDGKDHAIEFECWACQAVGKKFQVEEFTSSGKRVKIKQERRPTRCELCSVSKGIHAMHPLFDNHGMKGRQMHINGGVNGNKPRLAWCHTACAQLISANGGLVYGCTRAGWYEGDDEDDWDGRSENSELGRDETVAVGTIHHFVYCLKQNGKHNDWTKRIKELQQLRCTECGANDNKSLRIPLQCAAGTESENEELKAFHSSTEYCTQPMHVGCIRWSSRGSKNSARNVYYFAGNEDEDPVAHVYCNLHAAQVANGLDRQNRRIRGEPSVAVPRRGSAASVPHRMSTPTQRKRLSPVRAQSPASSGGQRRMKAAPVAGRLPSPAMPSLARAPSSHVTNGNAISGGRSGNASRAGFSSQPIPKRASQREAQLLDADDAFAIKKPKRGALLNHGLRTAEENAQVTRAKSTEDRIEEVLNDVLDEYLTFGDKDERVDYLKGKKNHWKRQLVVEMNKDDFIVKIWKPVLQKCNEERRRRRNSNAPIENETTGEIQNIGSGVSEAAVQEVSQQHSNDQAVSDPGIDSFLNADTGDIQSQAVSASANIESSGDANEQDQETPKRDWSKLVVGPTYDNKAFKFDEWDSFDVI